MRTPALALLTLIVTATTSLAADAPIDYDRDVKAVLRARCFACHGALKQESTMRLDTVASILRGGDGGAAIVPGDAAASNLIARVSSKDEAERMPPEGQPLTSVQIAAITAWIDQGAKAPADEQPEADPREHWAFKPPVREEGRGEEERGDAGTRRGEEEEVNPIDALLDAERAARGIMTVQPADKRLLLRRVYLDLIGLPPTREQMQSFLADERPDAYERVVDDLLDNPHHGERWGRHFMDIWRYTDWYGLDAQLRHSQKHIWHWRDWIVESLNADKGYDRMILEMLAADEIAPTDQSVLRASGFLARNYYLFNRTTWLDETIEHTSKAFFGLTLNCTKCHDHKYDPISQLDYYRLRAIFEPHQARLDAVAGVTDLEKDGLPRVFDAHPDAATYIHVRGDDRNPDKSRPIEPGVPALLAFEDFQPQAIDLPAVAHNPALRAYVLEDQLKAAEAEIAGVRNMLTKAREELAAAKGREEVAKAEIKEEAKESPTEDGAVFLDDNFDAALPDVWETGPGTWEYEEGKLIQSQTGFNRAYLRTKQDHPADFQATLKFKTTGGEMWKSVGLAFDCVEGREKLVYLSAVAGGSKLQVAYKAGGDYVYPPESAQSRVVELSKPYELTIRVRGPLVNVAIDGQHSLAYHLPIERETGKIDLVAFDAAVEFDALVIRDLPAKVKLMPAAVPANASPAALSVDQAAVVVTDAEKALAIAELKPELLRTAHAADVSKHQSPLPDNLSELITAAARAARKHEAAQAEQAVTKAEQKLAAAADDAKPQVETELTAARAALEKAQAAIDQPGEAYTSLRASLKALEGPDESEESRNKPYPATSTGRRTALARWIVDRRNPLTARVAVNHLWLRHFGQPLVESVEDFGLRAPLPPQHKLLNWLAVELMENGWSLKHLHRLIVTSRAYRLGGSTHDADEATAKADPNNDYYWRRKPARMESQAVRDSLLQLAGVLDPTLGGPTINPSSDEAVYRRSLYFNHSRENNHKFLTMFDDADIFRCYRRGESIIPQQALTLANSKLALTMSRKITAKLTTDLGVADDDQFIRAAFELVLAAQPNAEELAACREAMTRTRELLAQQNNSQPGQRARENLIHALINHNDFVTIQ